MDNFNQSETSIKAFGYRMSTNTSNGEIEVLDGAYGPWKSFNEFYKGAFDYDVDNDSETIIEIFGSVDEFYNYCLGKIKVGLTIGIVEDNKVVEYWKPVAGEGFIKKFATSSGTESGGVSEEVIEEIRKEIEDNEFVVATALNDLNSRLKNLTAAERVDTYSSALVLATNENIGKIVNVIGNETVEGILHPSGLYIITGVNKLFKLDGIGGSTGDSSTILQYLDDISVEGNDNGHRYISSLKKNEGSIVPITDCLDTNKILMKGDETDDNGDFLTVTGVTVGDLKNGDKISNGTSLETLIRRMLQKEIDVVANKPTVSLKGHPSGTYEIGTSLSGTLSYTFKDGYFSGANSAFVTNQPANCSVSGVTYSPSETYNITVASGNNTFGVSVNYTANTNIPKTNTGKNSNVNIPAGTATDSKSVVGKYKIWLGSLSTDYTKETVMTDSIRDVLLSNGRACWENEKPTLISMTNNNIYYAVIPTLSTDKRIKFNLGPADGYFNKMFDFSYTLPNGVTKSYTVLYTKAQGELTNLNWNY